MRLGGIGNPGVSRRIGEACGFDFQMQSIGRLRCQLVVERGEDVEDEKGNDTLAIRWAFVDSVPTEAGRHRRHVFASGFRKILQCVQAAMGFQMRDHVRCHGAFVKAVTSLRCDPAQSRRQLWLAMHLADARCTSVGQENVCGSLVGCQEFLLLLPVAMDAGRDGVTLLGIANGGC